MASQKQPTKKIINSPETCVDDNLRGVVAACPQLHLHPKHRVVTVRRKDDSGRVALLGGGGSGHEPFATGFLGSGMLDGAVAGGVFAAPPTGHVLYAIMHLFKYNSGGVLVVIGNYTGDRLNFGKAIEKAKMSGVQVVGLIVGEDVATAHNKIGGRSMCGEVFFYKLCGAMAAKCLELERIREMALEANKNMATLGVCLSACSLPGQPPLFEIAHDEMELGAGAHGEAGIKKLKIGTSKEVVTLILDQIISHLSLVAGDRVAVMVNNLGGSSFMEMNIINADAKDYLESKNIKVERIFSGHLKTSLEMHGFQLCLLNLNKEHGDFWLELLDYPTSALDWSGGELSLGAEDTSGDDDTLLRNEIRMKITSGPTLTSKHRDVLRGALQRAGEELSVNEELLNRLDSGCGDGDCGNTLKKFGHAILNYLTTATLERISNVLWELSEMAETDMGGTSGGLYSLGLSAASQTFSEAKTNDVSVWLEAWKNAMKAITKYGGAEPGDRTMLDTLSTAADTFKENIKSEFKILLRKTAAAAEDGAQATIKMSAKAGRASYVASANLQHEDAGARAAAIWLHAILNHIADNY